MAVSELFKRLQRERREREGREIPTHTPLPPKSIEELEDISRTDKAIAHSARFFPPERPYHYDADELCEEEEEEEGID